MSRKLRIIGVIILVLSIGIIVAAVYVIDVTKLFRPSIDTTTEDRVETKVGMIFPTKVGGDEWFMDPNRLKEDKRFDANANLTKNPDGASWSVDSKEQTRLNIWTKGSGDFRQKSGMDTYNQSIIAARGFWYKPSDWKNTEITGYFKLNEYVKDEYSTYTRSVWHNRTHNGCGGSDYKLKLHFDGFVSLDKEEWHVHYTDQPKPPWVPEHKRIED
jgi:hypothetical protein